MVSGDGYLPLLRFTFINLKTARSSPFLREVRACVILYQVWRASENGNPDTQQREGDGHPMPLPPRLFLTTNPDSLRCSSQAHREKRQGTIKQSAHLLFEHPRACRSPCSRPPLPKGNPRTWLLDLMNPGHARPLDLNPKSNFEDLSTFGDKGPQNGTKETLTAPRTQLG